MITTEYVFEIIYWVVGKVMLVTGFWMLVSGQRLKVGWVGSSY